MKGLIAAALALAIANPVQAATLLVDPDSIQEPRENLTMTLVSANSVNLRVNPSKRSTVFARMNAGDIVYITKCQTRDGIMWAEIYTPELREFGWISTSYLVPIYFPQCQANP
jgi:SH3-like domain-containing protein